MFLGLLLIKVKDNVSIEVINNLKFIVILIYGDCVNFLKKPWLFNFAAKIWKFHQTIVYIEKKNSLPWFRKTTLKAIPEV